MAFLQIISNNILPLLVFIVLGYLMDRKFDMNVQSLTKLTFYVVLPCFIFYSIYSAHIDMAMINVFLAGCLLMFILFLVPLLIGKIRGYTPGMREAFRNGTMFSNTGNLGIALIALIFSHPPYVVDGGAHPYLTEALAASTMLLVQMNMTLNTLGLYQAGKGKLTPRDALAVIFHMPVVYVLVAVFAVKLSGLDLHGTFVWPLLQNCANALVAIVMLALGMQIHRSRILFGDVDAWIACFVKLIVSPAIAWCIIMAWDIFGSGFSPIASQVIFITAAIPAAVNTVLYAVEFHNCEDFATEMVMMSTFASCITLTVAIYLARVLFPM